MTKSLLEFVSILQLSPSAIAQTVGNGWTADDVVRVTNEICANGGITMPAVPSRTYGALPPDQPEFSPSQIMSG
jgi:hypothetical protein